MNTAECPECHSHKTYQFQTIQETEMWTCLDCNTDFTKSLGTEKATHFQFRKPTISAWHFYAIAVVIVLLNVNNSASSFGSTTVPVWNIITDTFWALVGYLFARVLIANFAQVRHGEKDGKKKSQ